MFQKLHKMKFHKQEGTKNAKKKCVKIAICVCLTTTSLNKSKSGIEMGKILLLCAMQ